MAVAFCMAMALRGAVSMASAQETGLPSAALPVDHFAVRYGLEHPQLPPLADLEHIQVGLRHDGKTWRSAVKASEERLHLDAVPAGSEFDRDALSAIAQELVHTLNGRGVYGVWVTYSDIDIKGAGLVDNRPPGNHGAQIVVWASQVAEVRTIARGQRFKAKDSINNPRHQRIIASSPLQPGSGDAAPGALFRQEVLEHYLIDLSGEPGRRVEASIASAGLPGKVVLDYLVTETKPWLVFAQASNTGTASTDPWRLRVGFQDHQLTNHDDVLNVDFIATPDVNTYGVFASYRLPLVRRAHLDLRVYGSYGDFVASDTSLQSVRFGGKNWLSGVELSNRLTVFRSWELTSGIGGSLNHYEINIESAGTTFAKNSAEFFTPYLSAALSRETQWWSVGMGLRIDDSHSANTQTDASGNMASVGRIGADTKWTSVRWNVSGSIYLEPLLHSDERTRVLANEVSARFRGRMLLRGKRLIPQEEEPLGGALSVRGYPEAVLSADEFALATAEYAFHLPRTFKPGERGKLFGRPFSWRPPQPHQRADWDFIVRGFFDYGYRSVSESPGLNPSLPKPLADRSLGLAGAGGGVELLFWQNISVRCDVGSTLTQLRDASQPAGHQVIVPAGHVRAHFVTSVSW